MKKLSLYICIFCLFLLIVDVSFYFGLYSSTVYYFKSEIYSAEIEIENLESIKSEYSDAGSKLEIRLNAKLSFLKSVLETNKKIYSDLNFYSYFLTNFPLYQFELINQLQSDEKPKGQ